MQRRLSIITLFITALLVITSCRSSQQDTGEKCLPDTLRVGTLYSPTSFFIYRNDTLGYDYDRICDFAKDKKIALKFTVAHNINGLLQLIKDNKVDVLAYEIPVTAEFNQQVLHCGETNTTYQVLVQPSAHRISDVTQLKGKDVYVEKGSKYESRLKNLNDEIGGGINIHLVNNDTTGVQDLVEQVSNGKIPLTIVDSDIAKINKTYYSNIDITLEVSFPQRSSWAVNLSNDWLCDSIDAWSTSQRTILYSENVSKHYFEQNRASNSDGGHYNGSRRYVKHNGDISPYDDLFKAYANMCPYSWEMLAAIAHTESQFNPNVESWAGAKGLMQIMPSTVRKDGITPDMLYDPEVNMKCAVKELNYLDKFFAKYVSNPQERMRFVLAGYNGGMAHILDAIKLAEKYGKNPQVWYGNVEEALKWKSVEKYYNDPVCKYGYFRSTETVNYVHRVEDCYNAYRY